MAAGAAVARVIDEAGAHCAAARFAERTDARALLAERARGADVTARAAVREVDLLVDTHLCAAGLADRARLIHLAHARGALTGAAADAADEPGGPALAAGAAVGRVGGGGLAAGRAAAGSRRAPARAERADCLAHAQVAAAAAIESIEVGEDTGAEAGG